MTKRKSLGWSPTKDWWGHAKPTKKTGSVDSKFNSWSTSDWWSSKPKRRHKK